MIVRFTLNGKETELDTDPSIPLLDVLRETYKLTGTKRGCDYEGECGACTVLLEGEPIRSCLTPIGKVQGRRVMTIEGLSTEGDLHPLQESFIEVGAVQCGYCTPGMLLSAKALLDREPAPAREAIIEALEGNLCRCTGYHRIINGVKRASARLRGSEPPPLCDDSAALIGGDTRRRDAIGKVTGRTQYVEDMNPPDLLHMAVLRSPHPHACLMTLETDAAERVPGVLRVITANDVPGENFIRGFSLNDPVLTPVGRTLKMLGAPIALLVAESPGAAKAGLDAMIASYDVLPHTFSMDEALADDGVSIYGEGNVLNRYQVVWGDLDGVLEDSNTVVETEYRTSFQEHAALERDAYLGMVDEEGRITVVGGNHEPHWQQTWIAGVLGLETEAVRVITPPTGGSFGNRQDAWPFAATALAVYYLRRPVRYAFSRRESFDASTKRHPYYVKFRVGTDSEGRLTGLRVRILANTGGYDAMGYHIANYSVTGSGGAYRYQAVDARSQVIYTNGPRCGAFRGFGAPQSVFALEATLDELIEALDDDPVEFRLRNALPQDAPSFLGFPVADRLGYVEVLQAIRPHYHQYQREADADNQRGNGHFRKGVGLAGLWHRFGKSGGLRVETHAELARNGRFVAYVSAADYGQGIETALLQVASEALGVPRNRVEMVNADSALVPDSGISGASRSTFWVGNSVWSAFSRLKDDILATAAELLDCPPADLALSSDSVISPTGRLAFMALAEEYDRIGKPRRVPGFFDLTPGPHEEAWPEYTPHFVTGAQLAQVLVDMRTGETQVLRMVAAHDVGRAVNPVDAAGQIEGAILMGLGAALMEEYIPGASTGLGDYYLPTVRSLPEIETILVEVPGYHGPYGLKGLGEPALFATAPAIINALSRAIGHRVRELPATPERVLAAMQHDLAA